MSDINELVNKEEKLIGRAEKEIQEARDRINAMKCKEDERAIISYQAMWQGSGRVMTLQAARERWLRIPEEERRQYRDAIQAVDSFDSLVREAEPLKGFREDLDRLLNRYSRENVSNTPDFVLGKYLQLCLIAGDELVRTREEYYGVHMEPGKTWIEDEEAFDEGPDLPDEVGTGKPNGEGGYYPALDPFAEPVTDATDQSGAWKS